MDLSTIKKKLSAKQYENAQECIDDVKLMFQNCYTFNIIPEATELPVSAVFAIFFPLRFMFYVKQNQFLSNSFLCFVSHLSDLYSFQGCCKNGPEIGANV